MHTKFKVLDLLEIYIKRCNTALVFEVARTFEIAI